MPRKIIDILTSRNSLVIIILTLGLMPLYIIHGGFYIFGDSTTQMLPFLYETKRMLSSGDLPLWSWNTYAGQDFLFTYAYYTTTNPFVWINCLFPYSMLGVGFTFTIYLKLLVCAYMAELYFRKMELGRRLSMVGALLYTFSSWGLTAMYYYMFIDPMILFPLLLLSIERFLRGDSHRYTGIAAATFLVIWINYYFTPGTLIAAAIYFFCRVLSAPHWRRRWLRLTLQAMLSVLLGIALAGVVLVPVYYLLHGTPRSAVGFHFDWFGLPERLLSILFPKISEGKTPFILVTSFYNINAAYVVVFGILGSVLMLIKRRSWINWLFCIYAVLYLTPANGIFSLFTSTEYTRWAYALVLTMVMAILYYIKYYGFPRPRVVLLYIIAMGIMYGLTGGLSALWHLKNHFPEPEVFRLWIAVTLLVVLNLGCLYYLARSRKNSEGLTRRIAVCITICATAQTAGFSLWAARTGLLSSEKDLPINKAMDYEPQDQPCTLTERTFLTGADFSRGLANRGLMLGVPGVQAFNSVRDCKMYDLTVYVDTTDERYLSFAPSIYRDSYAALMSIRRSIAATDLCRPSDVESKAVDSPYYIPMGMAYDSYQLDDSIRSLLTSGERQDVPLSILSAIAISPDDEADFAKILTRKHHTTDLDLDSVVQVRRSMAADYVRGDTRGLSAHISLDKPSAVFFSFPASEGFSATADGAPIKIYTANIGMTAVILPAGSHNIRFDYFPKGAAAGFWISLFALTLSVLLFFVEKSKKL